MAKVGQTYLDGGTWRGEQVVPSRWVELSTRTHVETPNAPDYGYQWWCGDFRHHGRAEVLHVEGSDGTTMDLVPLGNDRFRGTLFDLLDMRLEFEADAEGNVRGLTASFGFRESVLSKRI